MTRYPWLTSIYQRLVQQHQQERGHHAQLLYATPGCGAEQLIVAFTRWLLCHQVKSQSLVPIVSTAVGGCGRCHTCMLMLAENHPDCQFIKLEEEKDQLGIEQIRSILPRIYACAQQGGAKVIAFFEGERLSEAAANALLKILEEPPPKTYFLMLCRTDARLPATLLSRFQQWHIAPPTQSQAVEWLQLHDRTVTLSQAMFALRLSLEAPLAALSFLQGPLPQYCDTLSKTLMAALQKQDLFLLLSQLDHDNVQWSLHWLAIIWLDASKRRLQAPAMAYPLDYLSSMAELVINLAMHFTNYQLQQCCRYCLSCRYALQVTPSLNRKLLLTDLLCRLQNHLSFCKGEEQKTVS